jgi:hypothetical protein
MSIKHEESKVVSQLSKKHDVRVTQNRQVLLLNGTSNKGQYQLSHDLGNKSWGKIDFLVNHCGYRRTIVAEY